MAIRVDIKIEGLERDLQDLARQVHSRAHEIVEDTVREVELTAKTLAPVRTGALRQSIEGEITGHAEGNVHDGVHYGKFQEFGTVNHGAQPFLSPAIASVAGSFHQKVRDLTRR